MPPPASGFVPASGLSAAVQTRNLLLFAGCVGMVYLAAPVLSVAAGMALVVVTIAAGASPRIVVLARAVINGLSLSTSNAPAWEALGRGVSRLGRGGLHHRHRASRRWRLPAPPYGPEMKPGEIVPR